MALTFNRNFDPAYGTAVTVADGVQRLCCPNPGPFTWHGTNTYLIGERDVAVLDPGPNSPQHIDAILSALNGRTVSHIVISHTHSDHSPGAALLQAKTGAPIIAEGPHRAARPLQPGETNMLDAACDYDLEIDHRVAHGDSIDGTGWSLEVIATPGHTANHLAFALQGSDILFSADHVMAWSTSIVAPPDGSMKDFMTSLDTLLKRQETRYLPGHGGPVEDAHQFVEGLIAHRKNREKSVLDRLALGSSTIQDMVAIIYRDVDKSLHGAAALSLYAHIEDLLARGLVHCAGIPSITQEYSLVQAC